MRVTEVARRLLSLRAIFSFFVEGMRHTASPSWASGLVDERLAGDSFPTGIINAKSKEAGSGGRAGNFSSDYEEDRREAGAGARRDRCAYRSRDDPAGGRRRAQEDGFGAGVVGAGSGAFDGIFAGGGGADRRLSAQGRLDALADEAWIQRG